jgi:hypothetical protein
MGITSTVIMGASAYSQYDQAKTAKKDLKKAQEEEKVKLEAQELENEQEDAQAMALQQAATPFSGTSASTRIALERQHLRRTSGGGRSGTVIRDSAGLG